MIIAAFRHTLSLEAARPGRDSLSRRLQDALPLVLHLAATLGLALLPTAAATDAGHDVEQPQARAGRRGATVGRLWKPSLGLPWKPKMLLYFAPMTAERTGKM